MTEDIKQMMTELTALFNKDDSLPKPRPPNPSTTAVAPKLLLKPEVVQAHSEYLGPGWKHLLVMPGDVIDVYAYLNKTTVIGYNTRTHLGGQFPVDIAKKIDLQPNLKAEFFTCTLGTDAATTPESLGCRTG